MGALPDVNFWLALAWEEHSGHAVARAWWKARSNERICFCRPIQAALLRLLTNRLVMKGKPKSQTEAWQIYDALRSAPGVEWVGEPEGLETEWRGLSSRTTPSTGRWADDSLAAWALLLNLRVITFDADFKIYPGLMVELLAMPGVTSAPSS
jgi:toxin-antitoxin system PIN domain toxin